MTEERKTPGPGATGAEGYTGVHFNGVETPSESSIQGPSSQAEDELRQLIGGVT